MLKRFSCTPITYYKNIENDYFAGHGFRSASKQKFGSGIRVGTERLPIHNTAFNDKINRKLLRRIGCFSHFCSFTDPGCLSRIADPEFVHFGSRIQKRQQKRGVTKKCCRTFFCTYKNHKIENYINVELVKKKFCVICKESQNFLPKKLSLRSQKYGFGIRDPESGIRKKPIPDPGSWSRGQKGTGSRIRIRNTALLTLQDSSVKDNLLKCRRHLGVAKRNVANFLEAWRWTQCLSSAHSSRSFL